jgi:hypothetical protein
MKRSPWPRSAQPVLGTPVKRVKPVAKPLERPVRYAAPSNEPVFAQPKEGVIEHEGYKRLVRQLPCAHCGIEGYTQFCHSDEGKGIGIKTDCRRGWPGCGPHGASPGCHYLIGSTGTFTREERRALEDRYAAGARARINAAGLWPAALPQYDGKSAGTR